MIGQYNDENWSLYCKKSQKSMLSRKSQGKNGRNNKQYYEDKFSI